MVSAAHWDQLHYLLLYHRENRTRRLLLLPVCCLARPAAVSCSHCFPFGFTARKCFFHAGMRLCYRGLCTVVCTALPHLFSFLWKFLDWPFWLSGPVLSDNPLDCAIFRCQFLNDYYPIASGRPGGRWSQLQFLTITTLVTQLGPTG